MARSKLCASTTFESLPLSTCTVCQQKSYISKGIQPIFVIFPSARQFWRWAFWGESSRYAVILLLQRQGENFAVRQHLKFGIWMESFRRAGVLLSQWQGENFAHRQHLKVCHFQPVHCASKNPISPKVFNRFSKPLPQREDFERVQLGGMFQGRRYFTFAMARWKLCASTTFESLPLSTCSLCQQKFFISKGIRPIFVIFPSARQFWRWAFLGGNFKVRRYFGFPMARWRPFVLTTFEILPLSTCTHCQQKPISPKVFNRFSKSLPQLEDVEGGHLVGMFQVRRYFTFAMARWKLCVWKTCESLPLSTFTLCPQKSHVSKGIQPIFEIFAPARRFWGWTLGEESFRCADVSLFAMAKRKLGASTTFEILPLSTCSLSQQKSCISKGIHPIFEIFASARRCWGWAFGWKVSCAQVVYCCHGKAKTLRIDNIWNFATFNLYSVPAKTYISKGIQPIFEIFASARRCWGWAFGWNVSGAQVFYFCTGKVKTLLIENMWKFAAFNLYTVPAKISYIQRYSTDFRNLCPCSKIMRVDIWV